MNSPRLTVLAALFATALLAPAARAAEGVAAQGIQLFAAGRVAEGEKLLDPWVAAHPKDAEATYYLGRCRFSRHDYDGAVDWLEKATELAPKNAEYQLWLGRACGRSAQEANMLRAAGLAKHARAAWERAVALDPGQIDARGDLVQFYLQAPGFMGGSVDKARAQAAEIQKRDAARGASAFANIALHEKDPAAAIRVLEAAVAKAPADARVRLHLAGVYASQKRWDDAFAAFEALLAADPDQWDAMYGLGRTAAVSGQRLDRGQAALQRYLAHTPGPDAAPLANAHYRLGMILEHRGDKKGARAEYETALRLDPKLEDAKKALDKLV